MPTIVGFAVSCGADTEKSAGIDGKDKIEWIRISLQFPGMDEPINLDAELHGDPENDDTDDAVIKLAQAAMDAVDSGALSAADYDKISIQQHGDQPGHMLGRVVIEGASHVDAAATADGKINIEVAHYGSGVARVDLPIGKTPDGESWDSGFGQEKGKGGDRKRCPEILKEAEKRKKAYEKAKKADARRSTANTRAKLKKATKAFEKASEEAVKKYCDPRRDWRERNGAAYMIGWTGGSGGLLSMPGGIGGSVGDSHSFLVPFPYVHDSPEEQMQEMIDRLRFAGVVVSVGPRGFQAVLWRGEEVTSFAIRTAWDPFGVYGAFPWSIIVECPELLPPIAGRGRVRRTPQEFVPLLLDDTRLVRPDPELVMPDEESGTDAWINGDPETPSTS